MDKMIISTQLVNAIIQYLSQRPFVEVNNLISGIQQEAKSQFPAPEATPETPKAE